MTLVHALVERPTNAGLIPARGSHIWQPTRRRIDPPNGIVMPSQFSAKIGADYLDIDGETVITAGEPGEYWIEVEPAGPDWVWEVTERVAGADQIRYFSVPDEAMIEYTDLLENYQVDPDTLDPAAEPEAAWWTFANGLADDAADAVVSGTIVGDDLILTQNDGDTINAGNVRGPIGPGASDAEVAAYVDGNGPTETALVAVAGRAFTTVAAMLASTQGSTAGTIWRAEGYRYEVAATGASDHHLTTAGGIKLYVRPINGSVNLAAFGVTSSTTNITPTIVTAATVAKRVIVPYTVSPLNMTQRWDGNGTWLDFERGSRISLNMSARSMDLTACKLTGAHFTSAFTGPSSAGDNNPAGNYVSNAREVRLGNGCVVDDYYHENAAGGLNITAGSNISITRAGFKNIRHYKGWGAPIHVSGASSFDVRIRKVKIEDSDRGIEIESGARDISADDGYQKNIYPIGYTGQPGDYATYTFVLGAHSHDGEGSCRNITAQNWLLENCGGGVAFVRSTGTDPTDMPRNCSADGIRILGNAMTTGYEMISVQGYNNLIRNVDLMQGTGATSLMRIRVYGGNSETNKIENVRADAFALPFVTIDNAANNTILDNFRPGVSIAGTGWLFDVSGASTTIRNGYLNPSGTTGYVRFTATADKSATEGLYYSVPTAETFAEVIRVDGADFVRVDVQGSNFATVPPVDIKLAGAARYATLSGAIDRGAGSSVVLDAATSRNRKCGDLLLSTSSASVSDSGTENDVSGIQRGNFTTTNRAGNASIANAASTAVINHGVSGTPTVITVTPRGGELIWVSARTGTTFTVSRVGTTGALAFDWRVDL